jgi:DNA repair exonuclease SbcCD ATPase subunit
MENWNYFNYFTEIEEYFWQKRGAHLLVSPLDWAIMETWQKAGVPLDAVLKGIDRAFESYQHSRRGAGKPLKNLAYCVDAVLEAAEEQTEAATGRLAKGHSGAANPAFSIDELHAYFLKNAEQIAKATEKAQDQQPELAALLGEVQQSLTSSLTLLEAPSGPDLEDLERRLTVLDDKLLAALSTYASDGVVLGIRREMDAQLAVYRRKMKPAQLAMVEKQFLQKRLLEHFGLPRLSLFYLT